MTQNLARHIEDSFLRQAKLCHQLEASWTANLLRLLVTHKDCRAVSLRIMRDWRGDAFDGALPLRLIGGLRYMALEHKNTPLARFFFDATKKDSTKNMHAIQSAFTVCHAMRQQEDFLRSFIKTPVQTNEVNRAAGLLGGFLTAIHHTNLPLRLREIGASAGLNLLWDKFLYDLSPYQWHAQPSTPAAKTQHGAPQKMVRVATRWQGPPAPFATKVKILDRKGCDISPLDITNTGDARRLMAYVWQDQKERQQRLKSAIDLAKAQQTPVLVEKVTHTASWILQQYMEPFSRENSNASGQGAPLEKYLTVFYHSIVWPYFDKKTRHQVKAALRHIARKATVARPVAWLRLDTPRFQDLPKLQLTLWPGNKKMTLAHVHPHATHVRWTGALEKKP